MDAFADSKSWCDTRTQLNELAQTAIYSGQNKSRCWFYCVNLYTVGLLQKDQSFASVRSGPSFAIADGVIVSILSFLKGWPKRERITGGDAFDSLITLGSKDRKIKCFFFGSDGATLELIERRFEKLADSAIFVGGIAPPFSKAGFDDFDEGYVRIINEAAPDVLFVGLTQPKQELWVHKNFEALNVPVAACVGAVFDFYAGNNIRAPHQVRRMGLEWVYRILQDPVKITKRFVYAIPSVLDLFFRK